jgi:hypothetical protein
MTAPWFVIYNPSCWVLFPLKSGLTSAPRLPQALQTRNAPFLGPTDGNPGNAMWFLFQIAITTQIMRSNGAYH